MKNYMSLIDPQDHNAWYNPQTLWQIVDRADARLSTGVCVDVAAAAATAKEAWYNQRRLYRQLRRRKSSEFWSRKIDANRADPKSFWR